MSQQRDVSELFDELAATYDTVGADFFSPIGSGLVNALDPRRGWRALDVGCGRGAVLFALAKAVGAEGSVMGLDVSPQMVRETTEDVIRAGLDIEVRVGDAMAPELAACSFEVVASSLVLFFLPDPLVALQSWRELLVPGGRVGVSTFGSRDERWAETVDDVLRAAAFDDIGEAEETGRDGPFGSDVGMEELVSEAGFHDVKTIHSVVSPRFEDSEHWFRWSMSVGQRRLWQALPQKKFDKIKRRVLAAVDGCRDTQGRIGFDEGIRYTIGERR